MSALVVAILMMLALSFFCSLSEAALYAVPAARVENLRLRGTSMGIRLAALRERIERPITAILFLNTFANTMGATVAGGIFSERFGHEHVLSFSVVLTFAVLFFSEITPKSLGVGHSRTLAPLLAWPIQGIIWIFYPLVHVGEWIARLLSPARKGEGPSEDEIVTLAALGAKGGAIMTKEAQWVRNVLRLNNAVAGQIMTPRPVLVTVAGRKTVGELADELTKLGFNRLPVVSEEGVDHVTGIVLRSQLFDAVLKGEKNKRVEELQRPVNFVPASMPGHELLRRFIDNRTHMAIVLDEYGGTAGVVTLEDVVEEMLGEEILDEFDTHSDLREFARRKAAKKFKDSAK